MDEAKRADIANKKIIIVGAGASGMMAAISAAKELGGGRGILILEKNKMAGKKLLATGNGRCNFTNTKGTSWDYGGEFLQHRETSGFPDPVMYHAPPKKVIEEFRSMGIVPRMEEEGRVYPYSGRGNSVCEAMLYELDRLQVEIFFESAVKSLEAVESGKEGVNRFRVTLANGRDLECERLILAVGGKAGCQYGSEGDGYGIAKALGHRVIKPIPALVQLLTEDKNFLALKGVRAKAKAVLYKDDKKIAEEKGEIQFAEHGISGICVFNLSRFVRYGDNADSITLRGDRPFQRREIYRVKIDFMEDWAAEEIFFFLKERRTQLADRPSIAFLNGLLHEKLTALFIKRCGISSQINVADMDETDLRKLTFELKEFSVDISGTKSWKDAQVTCGGVDTGEINRETMESKRIPGLYFAGEIMDVDGPCGGYNLQWAFASGMVAGKAASQSIFSLKGKTDQR